MENFEIEAYIYLVLKVITIIGALNWGLLAIDKNYNIFQLISKLSGPENEEITEKILYIVITLSAVYIMLQRKTYLPFLDVTVVPVNKFLIETKQKDFELEITVNAGKGEKIIYWASNKKDPKNKEMNDYIKAYGDYENSGISLIDINGKAKIYIKCPQEYLVKFNKIIPKHVHYRVVSKGKLGPVKTINLKC
jgi:uncharacterized membrane protein YuzA (DUF378 family)